MLSLVSERDVAREVARAAERRAARQRAIETQLQETKRLRIEAQASGTGGAGVVFGVYLSKLSPIAARLRAEGRSPRAVWDILWPVVRALARRARRAVAHALGLEGPELLFLPAPAAPWPGPLVSAVVPADRVPREELPEVLSALRRQTLRGIETVHWEPATRTARVVDAPADEWHVAPGTDLGSTLLGKFAFAATAAVATLPAAYLESNAIALEGGGLEFALNVFGGIGEGPRVVARAECLGEDLALSPERIPPRGGASPVVGRVLLHPAAGGAVGPRPSAGTLPSERFRFLPRERCLLAREGHTPYRVLHVVASLDTVLPLDVIPAARPRVLVLFPYLAVGGAEKLTLDVLGSLRSRYEFVVAAVEPADPSLGSMAAEYRTVTPYVYLLPDLVPDALNLSAVSYLIRRYAVETLFVANGSNWIYDTAGKLRDRFPALHMVNQVYDHQAGWIKRYDPTVVRVFDRHVAPNPSIAEAYRERGVDPARIDLIYHGIEVDAFDPAGFPRERVAALRERLGLRPDRPVVTFPARLHLQKRPEDFLALARRFGPEEASFLMVGDGPMAEEIDRRLGEAGLGHLRRLPFHKPFDEILGVSDVVVVPSEYEALPLVLLMSQAMGRPVVATDVGAIREVLDLTGGGIVVDRPGDIDAFERGVRELLAAPLDRERVRARLRTRFDIEVIARQYGQALEKR
jgi:glycosyltransferase involved in cell wall biosynthesis